MVVPPVLMTSVAATGDIGQGMTRADFSVSWFLTAHLFYLPVILYLIWGKLHGTGRSVRVAAFLGMGYMAAFFVAYAGRMRFKPESMTAEQFDQLLGQSSHLGLCTGVFITLSVAVALSIRFRSE